MPQASNKSVEFREHERREERVDTQGKEKRSAHCETGRRTGEERSETTRRQVRKRTEEEIRRE